MEFMLRMTANNNEVIDSIISGLDYAYECFESAANTMSMLNGRVDLIDMETGEIIAWTNPASNDIDYELINADCYEVEDIFTDLFLSTFQSVLEDW